MKVKTEYAILMVVIVALGLYLAFRSTDRTTYNLPDIPDLNAADLTKIEIRHGDQTVTLTRQDDGWRVSPGDYPADTRLVKRMIDDLANLTVTALVSESQNYARYDLDDKHQIRVTAYQDGKVVRTFDIGKAADTMRHTHIVLAGNPNVYHARGNFRNDFDQTVESLRDKSVLAFKPDTVTEFTIETADNTFTLQKVPAPKASEDAAAQPDTNEKAQPAPEATWQIVNGPTMANKKVLSFLTDLSGLKCRAYLTDQPKTDFSKPTYLIRIQSEAASTLEIFVPADEKASEVPARSSLRRDPFTLSDFDVDPIKKFLADLKGDEKEAKADAGGSTSP
jgi:hypothetical protein